MRDPVREALEELQRVGLRGDVPADVQVPDLIVRSWRRSISSGLASGATPPMFRDIDTDTLLSRAADPVLDRWQHQLADTGATLFVSDRGGSIVARRISDSSVRRRLDRVHAAEGFDYSEESVGTNGLGTSMVEKRPVYIEGSQHYSDALGALACAAVPVCTPTGSVIGSISVGGPLEGANPFMLSLTREIGHQIEERLRASSRPQDLTLAMSFMRYRNSQRPTVVLDRETVLANTPGLPYVTVSTHVMLWELLMDHRWAERGTARFTLAAAGVEVVARRVVEGPHTHFVVHYADLPREGEPQLVPGKPDGADVNSPVNGPDGQQKIAVPVYIVDGPSGSGRATAGRADHEKRRGRRSLVEVMVGDAGAPWAKVADLLDNDTDVMLRRVENVKDHEATRLATFLRDHRRSNAGRAGLGDLVITACRELCAPEIRSALDHAQTIVRLRGLSETPERIPALVKDTLNIVDPEHRHTMSPAAMQSLVQWTWPGNVAELVDTLTTVVLRAQTSVIELRNLPDHLRKSTSRRRLTLMQSAERDAIIKALDAAGGNRSAAAELLGIGRTTLYRRLRQLGLDGEEGSL